MTRARRLVLGALLASGAAACDDGDDGNDASGEFIALQHDFDGLAQWMIMWSGAGEALKAHPAGMRTVYMKEPPAAGEAFARGTIIVKTMESSDVDSGLLIHAMAKRGGDFNPEGHGWEWFELALDDSDRPVIIWRGEAPPEGECYGCPPGVDPATELEMADCNSCHLGAADNDLVHSVPLP